MRKLTVLPPRTKGFTLIEALVALGLMALMALLSWKGVSALSDANRQTHAHSSQASVLQAGVAQWQADLEAISLSGDLQLQPNVSALDFDGRVLRLVRRSTDITADGSDPGLWVVGWALVAASDSQSQLVWSRWQSMPVHDQPGLQNAWQAAADWAQRPGTESRTRETQILPAQSWQIFYFRNNAWSNPLSSSGSSANSPGNNLPDAIRMELQASSPFTNGTLSLVWVRPTWKLAQ